MKNIKNTLIFFLDLSILTVYFILALICGIFLSIACHFTPQSVNKKFAQFVVAFDKLGNAAREAVQSLYED